MLCVGVDKDYQGRGISKALTKLLLQNSKNKGFYISKAECTSLYSTKALEKAGAKIENFIKYNDFTMKGGFCSCSYVRPF